MSGKRNEKILAIVFAVVAAVLYAINIPLSKILLNNVGSVIMAGLLYSGAGIGIGIMFLSVTGKKEKSGMLSRRDLPYVMGMVVLDISAPIFLMCGLSYTTSANASLLNNFEIVATAVIAFAIFKETISKKLWLAIVFVTLSSAVLSFEDVSGLRFSWGSLLVLAAAVCWGFENNCTRKISDKNTYEIVSIKGICCGIGSLSIGFIVGERLPELKYILSALLLGFAAYGLSIFFYIKAQKNLGAAKTSAYYAIAPFVGAILSFIILKERFTVQFFVALALMLAGTVIATADTLPIKHRNEIKSNSINSEKNSDEDHF